MDAAPRWCEELGNAALGRRVSLGRFAELHDVGRRLITGWWDRGRGGAGAEFESFVFTWVALNAWGECVTGIDQPDRDWVVALAANADVRGRTEGA
ncbi:MAG: hypothetical protein K2V38_25590, partial [Gemmataceae bacterium]|nr:hypothetical protein [Gemmataceae bacterium]